MDLRGSASILVQRGWCPMPLTLDSAGLPKRPIVANWPTLVATADVIAALPWDGAAGLGVVLGHPSGGLAAIDIDDVGLGGKVLALLGRDGPRSVRTIRKRAHVYVQEVAQLSPSRAFTIQWEGRTVQIELKAEGTQVAAPPTPGYELIGRGAPYPSPSIATAWKWLCDKVGIKDEGSAVSAGFPSPWRPEVPLEERNKSAYVEAHMLRQAQMPLGLALRYMALRWEQDYAQGDQDWGEVERTIRSAYRKGMGPGAF